MRDFLNRPGELWALILRTDAANVRLAVFVHGFRGNYLDTWGKLPAMIKDNADGRQVFQDWDYLFLGYDTRDVETYLDIAGIVRTKIEAALGGAPPFPHDYTRIALLGHSLGTLGIRQLLCARPIQPPNLLATLHSVSLFGTPLNGSPIAWIGRLGGYRVADALRPSNPQLRMLKIWTRAAFERDPWKRPRLVLGQDDKVVGYKAGELIEWDGDLQPPDQITLDHGKLVKPDSWENSVVVDYLERALS